MRQASLHALKDYINLEQTISVEDSSEDLNVNKRHFMLALEQLKPSVSAEVSNKNYKYQKLL